MPSVESGRKRTRRRRLSRSGDFERVYRRGRSVGSDVVVLYVFERAEGEHRAAAPRLGVSVSRRLGGAVERNRIKRLLREAFWSRADLFEGDQDVVLGARPPLRAVVAEQGLAGVTAALDEVIGRRAEAADAERA